MADRARRRGLLVAALFLAPALVGLAVWVLYPVGFTVWRSLFDRSGDTFVGAENFREMFDRDTTRRAVVNNLVWVAVAPALATSLGLVFAVLTERVRFATAVKLVLFMPMAISFLAAGVIFRLVYEEDADRGLANAAATSVVDRIRPPGPYPGARPSVPDTLVADGTGWATEARYRPGDAVAVGLVAVARADVPDDARPAAPPSGAGDVIAGTVWLDFTVGGGGVRGEIDPTELGLPGVEVEALDLEGDVVAQSVVAADGRFVLTDLDAGEYRLRLASSSFRDPWPGFVWLGPGLITPAVIGAFLWMWTGFALVVVSAGLAALPRESLEAARVDGASEWQVFRRVTVPLLWPVLSVLFVTLVINVLKIFDLVLVIAPGSSQDDANVVALELWRVSFGGARDLGLGSALGVLLFVLVVPAMVFQVRRFRKEAR